MYYGNIKKCDIADGEGVRVSLFVSGCTHRCKGCFQPETWDFEYGKFFGEDAMEEILEALKPAYIDGLTLLGGEPFEPKNQIDLYPFVKKVKQLYPQKDIWCYSGYTLEELLGDTKANIDVTPELLKLIDVLVDGEFIEEKKNISLRFRGSENQRIIDVKKTLDVGHVVLWDI